MKLHIVATFSLCLFLTSLLFSCNDTLMAMNLLRIGTGGETGVYYPIGKLIAEGITNKAQEKDSPLPIIIGVAQKSAGSVENILAIYNKEIEAGLVQADVASLAYSGEIQLSGISETSSIRAIASLYSEKFQVVVRKDTNIKSFQELKGKRISIDEEGSGTLAVMRIVLDAYDMKEEDLLPFYLKPVFTHKRLTDRQIDGFVMMAGAPMAAVTELLDVGVTLLPLDKNFLRKINKTYPYLFPGSIEEGTYKNIPEITTLEVYALLVVHEDMSEESAYGITRALFSEETLERLRLGHPQGKSITMETGLNGVSIPLHPGAKRFFDEQKKL
ncbi:TAXI family TRAP transporter solute-binding subunit [Desulfopila sp. IMCC35008]|uniref:TAXI family TRAP transporter solute-binding subunit n=1 Tax=Desulfopila sp. IMCC35008 TaxID=2653858 RepID=UPI001F0E80AB|nr:TAXI family TRAP transporter solute-binding subunit [Desulfopila sp. IMCC35008]